MRRSSRIGANNLTEDIKDETISNANLNSSTRKNLHKKEHSSTINTPFEEFKVNDHVLLRSENAGEPYYIGRIVNFIQDKHVRIAWFYRPQDVLHRSKSYPPRLLVASMHTDINPARSIVEKCWIKHESDFENEQEKLDYLQQDRCYVFHQLFDRFTKHVYEVVPSNVVQNRPPKVLELLRQFPYILVEEGRTNELLGDYQECPMCAEWVPKIDSLQCVDCNAAYHAACLTCTRKPKIGYRWQCHFCATNQPKPIHAQRNSDALTASRVITETHSSTTFPFTYFGLHCSNADAYELDLQHPLYPKLASRIAPKYQANIPKFLAKEDEKKKQIQQKLRPTRKRKNTNDENERHHLNLNHCGLPDPQVSLSEYHSTLPMRGLDSLEKNDMQYRSGLLFDSSDSARKNAMEDLKARLGSLSSPISLHDLTFLDRILYEMHRLDYNPNTTIDLLKSLCENHYQSGTYPEQNDQALHASADCTWSDADKAAFLRGVREHGSDLLAIQRRHLPNMPTSAIVLYMYRHKKERQVMDALGHFLSEHDIIDANYLMHTSSLRSKSSSSPRLLESIESSNIPSLTLFESSESEHETIEASRCSLCRATSNRYIQSNLLRTAVTCRSDVRTASSVEVMSGTPSPKACHVLCEACGTYWLRYGAVPPSSERGASPLSAGQDKHAESSTNTTAPTPKRRHSKDSIDNEHDPSVDPLLEGPKRKNIIVRNNQSKSHGHKTETTLKTTTSRRGRKRKDAASMPATRAPSPIRSVPNSGASTPSKAKHRRSNTVGPASMLIELSSSMNTTPSPPPPKNDPAGAQFHEHDVPTPAKARAIPEVVILEEPESLKKKLAVATSTKNVGGGLKIRLRLGSTAPPGPELERKTIIEQIQNKAVRCALCSTRTSIAWWALGDTLDALMCPSQLSSMPVHDEILESTPHHPEMPTGSDTKGFPSEAVQIKKINQNECIAITNPAIPENNPVYLDEWTQKKCMSCFAAGN